MDKLKRAAERKRKEARKSVTEIRTKMAGLLMNDNKVGNYTLCNPKQSDVIRNDYCTKNFQNDPDQNRDCTTSSEDFCYVCCENEFGRNKMDLRDRCYKLCDEVSDGTDKNGKGFWTFVPSTNTVATGTTA